MKGFWAFIYEEDGRFWGRFPELEGCYSDGADMGGLAANLTEALGLWIETREAAGLEVPAPRPLQDVMKIKVEDGLPLTTQFVPVLPVADKAKQVAMSIDTRKLDLIDAAAGKLGQSRSAFMVNAALAAAAPMVADAAGRARPAAAKAPSKRA